MKDNGKNPPKADTNPAPVIKDLSKNFPKNHVPPVGVEAFQMAREGAFWSVWAFRMTKDGIETEKVLEAEPFNMAREKTLSLMVEAQIRAIK